MSQQKNAIFETVIINNSNDVNFYENPKNNQIHYTAALNVQGGVSIKKGLKIGFQENLIPGLLMYDQENFFGYSEKKGLCLLSSDQSRFINLQIPPSIFENKKLLQPVQSNHSINKNSMDTFDSQSLKKLNIDIQVKDDPNYFIHIPVEYENINFLLHFDITFIYDQESLISHVRLVFINKSNKKISYKF